MQVHADEWEGMDPEPSAQENMYAPPAAQEPESPREPWTVGGCLVSSMQTSLASPVLAWVGLGVIPNLGALVGWLQLESPALNGTLGLLVFVSAAVLAGGTFTIALGLVRKDSPSLRDYIRGIRLAPSFLVLSLPLLPFALAGFIPELEPMSTVEFLTMVLFIVTCLFAVVAWYKLSLAGYALVDSNPGLRYAVAHSSRRIGANTGQFLALFCVTSIPFVISFSLLATTPRGVSTLFDAAVSPLVTLCWAHAYVSVAANSGKSGVEAMVQP